MRWEVAIDTAEGSVRYETIEAPTRGAARFKVAERWFDVLERSDRGAAFRGLHVRKLPDAPDPAKAEAEAAAWNVRNPVGTLVRYWTGPREGAPTGTGRTRHDASVLGGHTAVAWIDGCRGCVALTHVQPVTD